MSADRGLANCPAILPSFTTGTPAEYVRTTAICKMTLRRSRMESAENDSKDSAQSPACNRNALPSDTRPSSAVRRRDSPANTSGGNPRSCLRTESYSLASGQFGCCSAVLVRQESGDQETPEEEPSPEISLLELSEEAVLVIAPHVTGQSRPA